MDRSEVKKIFAGGPSSGSLRGLSLLTLGVLGAGILGFVSVEGAVSAARLGAGLLVLLTLLDLIRRRAYAFLLSPLFLLSISAAGFYSILPYLYVTYGVEALSAPHDLSKGGVEELTRLYLGSPGEALVLAFAALGLFFVRTIGHGSKARNDPAMDVPLSWLLGILVLSVVLTSLRSAFAAAGVSPDGGGLANLMALELPVLSLAFIMTCRNLPERWTTLGPVAAVLLLILAGGLAYSQSAKFYILIVVAGVLSLLVRTRPSLRRLIAVALALAALTSLALSVLVLSRGHVAPEGINEPTVAQVLFNHTVHKLIFRQGWTGYCFNNVVAEVGAKPPPFGATYFLSGPDKSSLSDGERYTIEYCKTPLENINPARMHSASITLLGEPLDKAGWPGFALAMIVLVGGLALLQWAALRQGAIGIVFLGGLLPWLVDFDQHFALYLSSAVKAGLVMGALLFVFAKLQKLGEDKLGPKSFLRSDRIRVLINAIHAKSGGGVTYLRNILAPLAERHDLELHLFLHKDQFDLYYPLPEGVRLHLMEFHPGFLQTLIWEQAALPLLARVMSADVTFSPANYGPLLAPNPVIVLRNSLAVVGKETRLTKRLYWAALTLMTAASLSTARRAIAVSEYARKTLTFGTSRLTRKRVRVVHHGIKTSFTPSRRKSPAAPYLLVVADLYVQKNLHTTLEAMSLLTAEFPDLTLKIAGKAVDQEYFEELRAKVNTLGLETTVEFLGPRSTEELVRLYQDCRVFVFPSTVETFGNPLVEAMASGAAIATSNTAAMPEVTGEAGLYFNPLNAKEMASQIARLLKDEPLRHDLRVKALNRAKSFSWEITANKTADILVEAAGRKP